MPTERTEFSNAAKLEQVSFYSFWYWSQPSTFEARNSIFSHPPLSESTEGRAARPQARVLPQQTRARMGATAASIVSIVAPFVVPPGRALAHAALDTEGRATRLPVHVGLTNTCPPTLARHAPSGRRMLPVTTPAVLTRFANKCPSSPTAASAKRHSCAATTTGSPQSCRHLHHLHPIWWV